eukprot:gb/GFBE01023508.1/.p1 GENE.gb/GFBE01023508.1/~~gb/GFBE01023508.1/.p1  ORF type:complete len:144 (+),score=28.13 gb/GFBE01023508.1/:1-432(+)
MPRGAGQLLFSAFASTGGDESSHDASEASWGFTSGKLFKRLHPKMQDFMIKVPGLRKQWEDEVNAVIGDTSKSADEVAAMKETLEKNMAALNKEIEENPRALDEAEDAIMGRQPAIACCPLILPPPSCEFQRRSRAEMHRSFL